MTVSPNTALPGSTALVPRIERHLHVTESRMHIGGSAAVVVVASPSDGPPELSRLRAFRLDRQGVLFRIGTWHALDAFPVADEAAVFLFLSDRATQRELFDAPVARPVRTDIHDFAAGVQVRIQMPLG